MVIAVWQSPHEPIVWHMVSFYSGVGILCLSMWYRVYP